MNNPAELEKWIWSDEEFERMGWHDVGIRGMAFLPETAEFVLDIDYIFKWIEPKSPGGFYEFWVSPATLVFQNAYDLRIDAAIHSNFSLEGISRRDPVAPRNQDYINKKQEWTWVLDSAQGEITLQAVGYEMFVRAAPTMGSSQTLDLAARGGLSFDRI
jgi:hypothetical protein